MNLQSKFHYCITAKTLNFALYLKAEQTYRRTDRLSSFQVGGIKRQTFALHHLAKPNNSVWLLTSYYENQQASHSVYGWVTCQIVSKIYVHTKVCSICVMIKSTTQYIAHYLSLWCKAPPWLGKICTALAKTVSKYISEQFLGINRGMETLEICKQDRILIQYVVYTGAAYSMHFEEESEELELMKSITTVRYSYILDHMLFVLEMINTFTFRMFWIWIFKMKSQMKTEILITNC